MEGSESFKSYAVEISGDQLIKNQLVEHDPDTHRMLSCSVCETPMGSMMAPRSTFNDSPPPKCHDCIRAEAMADRIIAGVTAAMRKMGR